jgi:hypothetical protein
MCSIVFGCQTKEQNSNKKWYKGNLHTHSYWSDGDEFPEVIMAWYKSRGYQFVALTEHNILAEGEKWKTISDDSIYQQAFKSYLNTYSDDWINHRQDSLGRTQVQLKTHLEYAPLFEEDEKFLIIKSEEITDRFENKPIHMNATNIQKKIEPQGGSSVVDVLQNNIDQVISQRQETGVPMIPHINHPNFGYGVSLDDMIALEKEQFFEVYNGHPAVHNSGDSLHISTEKMWDLINISYLQNNKPLMYGLATDDSHHYHRKGKQWSNAGRGWIMVKSDSLNPESLIQAMEAGDFYASTGVELSHLTFESNTLSVEVKAEPDVDYNISFIGCIKGEAETTVLESVKGATANFKVTKDLLFVRCKITSTKLHKNPVEDLIYESAWSQPFFFH